MLGLGIGLIAGAILLQIMNMGQGALNALTTKADVVKAAEELGLRVVEGDAKLLTEEEWKQQEQQTQGEEGQETSKEPVTPATPKTPEAPNNSAANDKGSELVTPSKPSTPTTTTEEKVKTPDAPAAPATKEIKFTISKGDYLSDVASGLEKAGIISSADQFQKEAVKKKVNYKLRIGTYTFTAGEEYSSIISKIASGSK